jgi:glycerol-3-phosphate acyltransferase PlsY
MGLPDPRNQGSGNPGATNVLRTGGKKAAMITLLGDALKGLVPVAAARFVGLSDPMLGVVALAAVGGHLYPLYFGFRGGKGVATTLGALFGMSWLLGLVWVLTWVAVAAMFRFSSLAALVAMVLTPVYVRWLLGSTPLTLVMVALAALIVWRHRSNLRNLIAGTETRI